MRVAPYFLLLLIGFAVLDGEASAQTVPAQPAVKKAAPAQLAKGTPAPKPQTERPRFAADGSIALDEALKHDLVAVRVYGANNTCGDALVIHIQRKKAQNLKVTLTPGTRFQCLAPGTQNMVGLDVSKDRSTGMGASQMLLDDDQEHVYVLEAYCLNIEFKTPTHRDEFRVMPVMPNFTRFLAAARPALKSRTALQAALWVEIRNSDLPKVRTTLAAVSDDDLNAATAFIRKYHQAKPAAAGAPPARPQGAAPPAAKPAALLPKEEMEKFLSVARATLGKSDTNKNGVLERSEWGRLSGYYDMCDVNRDGIVTTEEMVVDILSPKVVPSRKLP